MTWTSAHPEQEQFRDSVLRFAESELAPTARSSARTRRDYPWDVAKKMAKQGLLGITIPEADGGQGGTLMDAVLAIEAVAAACPRSADVVQAGNFGPIRVLAQYGSAEQKKRYLAPLLARRRRHLRRHDRARRRLRGDRPEDQGEPRREGYRVNGSKVFVTHSA